MVYDRRFASSGLMPERDHGVSSLLPETGPPGAEHKRGLTPLSRLQESVEFNHGLQRGYRFWMRHQNDDYYERHLLLHEFAHCFTHSDQQHTRTKGVRPRFSGAGPAGAAHQRGLAPLVRLPEWFLEGSAEVFATHRLTAHGREKGVNSLLPATGSPGAVHQRDLTPLWEFAVIPDGWDGFDGWGRVSEITRHAGPAVADDLLRRSIPLLADVQNPSSSLRQDDGRYAFWWALCTLLRHHPEYAADWKQLCGARRTDDFTAIQQLLDARAKGKLVTDWLLFAESVCEGFDVQRSFPRHAETRESGRDIAGTLMQLRADFGWQDSGFDFAAGDYIRIDCDGLCSLAMTTAPWISEPQGITIGWYRGRPVGEVLAVLVDSEGGISRRFPVGRSRRLRIPRPGRLWLQINDSEASRHDNSASFQVTFRHAAEDE